LNQIKTFVAEEYFILGISVRDLTLQKRNKYCHGLLLLMLCFTGPPVLAVQPNEIILSNEYWSVKVLPGTLEMGAKLRGGDKIKLSVGQVDLGEISKVVRTGNQVRWALEAKGVSIDVRLSREALSVRFFLKRPVHSHGRFCRKLQI